MNYYEILGSSPSATYEELKKNYQKLAKLTHPDKQELNNSTNKNIESSWLSGDNSKFIQIDEAWKVLRDVTQRKIYDSSLLQKDLEQTSVIYAEITFGSLHFSEDLIAYFPCRCGEHIPIHQDNFTEEEEEVLFECSECSNNILVTNLRK